MALIQILTLDFFKLVKLLFHFSKQDKVSSDSLAVSYLTTDRKVFKFNNTCKRSYAFVHRGHAWNSSLKIRSQMKTWRHVVERGKELGQSDSFCNWTNTWTAMQLVTYSAETSSTLKENRTQDVVFASFSAVVSLSRREKKYTKAFQRRMWVPYLWWFQIDL